MTELFRAENISGSKINRIYVAEADGREYITGSHRKLNFIFDTGAFISTLSVSNFIEDTSSHEYNNLVRTIDDETNYIEYNSVSGNGKGVLRKIRNVKIDDLIIDPFYFMLVKDDKRLRNGKEYNIKIALLGTDFTDFCRYSHDINTDIVVDEFDVSGYESYHDQYSYNGNIIVFNDLFSVNP